MDSCYDFDSAVECDSDDCLPTKRPRKACNIVEDCNMPVTDLVIQFGPEIQRTIAIKRRKLEEFMKKCNTTRERVNAILEFQRNSRLILFEEFCKRSNCVLNDWDCDMEKIQSIEDELSKLWRQQMKLLSQIRNAHSRRYKAVKQLHEQFKKYLNELECTHQEQYDMVKHDSNIELKNLQKKFIADTKCQDVTQVRKSLHSLLES